MTATDTEPRPAILIVDDVEANLVALEAQLANLDCDIVRATSGNDALRHLLHREFAVMLLDVQMPQMDGFEVAHLVRESRATRDMPIVFVTAMHETEESVLQGYGSGAIDFLFKPINARVLRSKVRVFLDLHLGRRRLVREIAAHKRTLGELEAYNYSISHDLRAPLRPLEGLCGALIEDYGDKLDEKATDVLGRIRAAARRMNELIDDLLELSKISQTPIVRRPVDLAQIARAVMDELRASEPARDVELVFVDKAELLGDARLLRIALENLLRNAWKFTAKQPRARIEFQKKLEKETVYFVRDNGVGFNQQYAARMFQPFQRFHRATDFEGTGIGLAIVSRIVEGHGGRIWADSEVGRGACFSFTLSGDAQTA